MAIGNEKMITLSFFFVISFAFASDNQIRICLAASATDRMTLAALTAQRLDFYRRADLRAKFSIQPSQSRVTAAVAEGDCDFGIISFQQILKTEERTLGKLKPVVANLVGKDEGVYLIAPTRSRVRSVQDLKGKKVFINDPLYILAFEKLLSKVGMKLSDVNLIKNKPVTEIEELLRKREIDAALAGPPIMPYLVRKNVFRVIAPQILRTFDVDAVPHSIIIAGQSHQKRKNDFIEQFQTAFREVHEYLELNPSELITTLQKSTAILNLPEWSIQRRVADRSGVMFGASGALYLQSSRKMLPNIKSLFIKHGETILKQDSKSINATMNWFP